MMLTDQELLTGTYRAFNARDIDTVLDAMHLDVIWPNGWEGGHVFGADPFRSSVRSKRSSDSTLRGPAIEFLQWLTELT